MRIDISPPQTYDFKLTILGTPMAQQRHRSTILTRKNTGITLYQCPVCNRRFMSPPQQCASPCTSKNFKAEKYYKMEDLYIHNYDPSRKDKLSIRRLVGAEAPRTQLTGPLKADVYLYFPYLKSHYGTGKNSDILKPNAPQLKDTGKDRDNCDKIILDALTDLFWPNDSQICAGRILKLYSKYPRTEIYITQLTKGNDNGTEDKQHESFF